MPATATATGAAASGEQAPPAAKPAGLPPTAFLRSVAGAYKQSLCLYTATSLGVSDALAGGPLPAAELAAAVGADADRLRRVMRLLVIEGVYAEPTPGVYANTKASALLCRAAGGGASERDIILHIGDESLAAWLKLPGSVLASHPTGIAWDDYSAGKGDYWQWLSRPENAEVQARFDRAMTANSANQLQAVLADYDWGRHAGATVADVGGGAGSVLAALLERYPGMRGVLFDRPPVIEEARAAWGAGGQHAALAPRAQLVAGSFFESVPPADVYFMKHILHDWSDARSTEILRVLRACAPPGARLLLAEAALPDATADVPAWMAGLDLQMMAIVGGRERSVSDWRALLAAGGFRLEAAHPLSSGESIIEAVCA